MSKQNLTKRELLGVVSQLKEKEFWLGEENHSYIEKDEEEEIVINVSPSPSGGYPKILIEENDELVDKSNFAEKIRGIKIKSVEAKKRYRYLVGENRVEKIHCFKLYPAFDYNVTITLEFPENYPDIVPPWSVFKKEETEEPRRMDISDIWVGNKKYVSFILDPEFIKRSESASANRVAGMEREKKRLKKFLKSNIEEEWGLKEERGLILEGPPGTGKTELTIEVCQEEFGDIPVLISGPQILSKWVGESERLLRQKFQEAWSRKKEEGRVVYIDELDAIARAREEVSEEYSAQIVSQLLVLLDGVEAKQEEPFKVVASTNLAHLVDPALRRPGRLGGRPLRFTLPDRETRKAILHFYLQRIYQKNPSRLGSGLKSFIKTGNEEEVKTLIDKTVDFSGADIEDLIVQTVDNLEGDELSSKDIEENVKKFEKSFFGASSEIIRDEAGDPEIRNILKKSIHGKIPGAIRISDEYEEDKLKRIAKEYFDLKGLRETKKGYRWRKLELPEFLDTSWVQTKENLINAFQHSNEEQICLYFPDFEYLIDAKDESMMLRHVWEIIHEMFLGWDRNNLLIVSSSKKSDLPGEIKIDTG